jgi:hypothetical protein
VVECETDTDVETKGEATTSGGSEGRI